MKMMLLCKTFKFQRSLLIFIEGLLLGIGEAGQRPSTSVAEVALEWVILCLGRRWHWAVLFVFLSFF